MRKDKFTKLVCFVSCLFICFCVVKIFMDGGGKTVVASSFSGGSGTEASPYLVKTVADLNQLASDTNSGNSYSGKYFKMANDIDFNNLGMSSTIYNFGGEFNGNGHIIRNLVSTDAVFNLHANDGHVKNLGLINCRRNTSGKTWGVEFGLMFSGLKQNASARDCFVIGAQMEESNNAGAMNGVFAGCVNNGATIENCYVFDSTLKSSSHYNSETGSFAFVNTAVPVSISNCFSNVVGDITGAGIMRGFCHVEGSSEHNISKCYYSVTFTNGTLSTSGYDNGVAKNLSTLTVSDLSNSYRLSSNARHPVLKIFDPDITITNSSNVNSIIKQNANSGINIGVSLSRTLNTQGQNDSVKIYLDNTLLSTITSSQTVTVPQATLNGLAVGSHTLVAKLISDMNEEVKTSNELTLNVTEIPIPDIESVTTTDNESSSSIFVNEAPNGGLQLKVNLSREQLNLNGQNYEIGLYLDGTSSELGILLGQASSTTFTIPKNTLNSWTAGEHKITAKLLDNNAVVGICAEDFIFVVHEDAYPEIERIDLVPTGHSQSQVDNLSSVSVTLSGKNFSPEYSVSLIFKNESGAEVLNLPLGKFNRLSTTSETFNITGAKLQQIKELGIARYSVEVEVSK